MLGSHRLLRSTAIGLLAGSALSVLVTGAIAVLSAASVALPILFGTYATTDALGPLSWAIYTILLIGLPCLTIGAIAGAVVGLVAGLMSTSRRSESQYTLR